MQGTAVGVKDSIRWEVQWHPASGASIRRLGITSRGVRRLIFALGIGVWAVLAGGVLAGLDGLLTRFAVDTVLRENAELKAR